MNVMIKFNDFEFIFDPLKSFSYHYDTLTVSPVEGGSETNEVVNWISAGYLSFYLSALSAFAATKTPEPITMTVLAIASVILSVLSTSTVLIGIIRQFTERSNINDLTQFDLFLTGYHSLMAFSLFTIYEIAELPHLIHSANQLSNPTQILNTVVGNTATLGLFAMAFMGMILVQNSRFVSINSAQWSIGILGTGIFTAIFVRKERLLSIFVNSVTFMLAIIEMIFSLIFGYLSETLPTL